MSNFGLSKRLLKGSKYFIDFFDLGDEIVIFFFDERNKCISLIGTCVNKCSSSFSVVSIGDVICSFHFSNPNIVGVRKLRSYSW